MAAPAASRSPWLYGPFWDLGLGCGGLYLLIFLVLALAGPSLLGVLSLGVVPLLLLITSVPHYGATLLRVYEHRTDRKAYVFFAVWASLAVWAAFVVGVYDVTFGSWMVTLFLTWSPWHYSGQNYGIGLMLLRRRGVPITPVAKRLIYSSFLLSWGLVVLVTHSAAPGASYTPTPTSLGESVYALIPLGIPLSVVGPSVLLVTIAYLGTLVASAMVLRRGASWRDLTPMLAIMGLQAIWFSFPVFSRATLLFDSVMPLGSQYQGYTLLWVALAHSLQYLWVTTYFATATDKKERPALYYLKTFVAGGALFAVPVFLFSPDLFGVYAFEAGLGVLVAAAVNLHHFILDGAIWKLRDGRIARVLLRKPDPDAPPAPIGPAARPWLRPLAWGALGVAGFAYAAFYVVGTIEIEYGFRRAMDPPDEARMRLAAERLERVGHDHPTLHLNLGILADEKGDLETALREVKRSLALSPNLEGWMYYGSLLQRSEDWEGALEAYDRALGLDPDYIPALARTAAVASRTGDLDRAEDALSRAAKLAPERRGLVERLRRVRRMRAQGEQALPLDEDLAAPAGTPRLRATRPQDY